MVITATTGRQLFDDHSFEDLPLIYGKDVRRFIARRVHDNDLVSEIVQETFLRAFRARHTFDPRMPPWPWLATIAGNLIKNSMRDQDRRGKTLWLSPIEVIEEQADGRADVDPERVFASEQLRAGIASTFAALTERQQRILHLKYFDDLPYEKIAAIESISVDAVKSALKRARAAFRAKYRAIVGDGAAALLLVLAPWRQLVRCTRAVWGRASIWWAQTGSFCQGPLTDSALQALSAAALSGALLVGSALLARSAPIPSTDPPAIHIQALSPAYAVASPVAARRAARSTQPHTAMERSEHLTDSRVRISKGSDARPLIDVGLSVSFAGEERRIRIVIPCDLVVSDEAACDVENWFKP